MCIFFFFHSWVCTGNCRSWNLNQHVASRSRLLWFGLLSRLLLWVLRTLLNAAQEEEGVWDTRVVLNVHNPSIEDAKLVYLQVKICRLVRLLLLGIKCLSQQCVWSAWCHFKFSSSDHVLCSLNDGGRSLYTTRTVWLYGRALESRDCNHVS